MKNKFNDNEQVKTKYLSPFLGRRKEMLEAMVKSCLEHDVPLWVMLGIAFKETAMNPDRVNDKTGAQGLMQVMPGTARSVGVDGDLKDMGNNIEAAARYLRAMHEKFGGQWALACAAYNAGDARVRGILKEIAPGVDIKDDKEKFLANPLFLRAFGKKQYACMRYGVEVGVGAEFLMSQDIEVGDKRVALIDGDELNQIYEQQLGKK